MLRKLPVEFLFSGLLLSYIQRYLKDKAILQLTTVKASGKITSGTHCYLARPRNRSSRSIESIDSLPNRVELTDPSRVGRSSRSPNLEVASADEMWLSRLLATRIAALHGILND